MFVISSLICIKDWDSNLDKEEFLSKKCDISISVVCLKIEEPDCQNFTHVWGQIHCKAYKQPSLGLAWLSDLKLPLYLIELLEMVVGSCVAHQEMLLELKKRETICINLAHGFAP